MHLTGIRLGGVPPFTEPIRLRFDERVNVFIGPNASGKSTVLSMMAEFFEVLYQNSNRPFPIDRRLIPDWRDDFPETELAEPFEWDQTIDGDGENILGLNEDWPSVEDDIPNFGPNTPLVIHFGSIRPELPDVTADPPPGELSEEIEEVMSSRPFSGYRTVWAYKLLGDEYLPKGPNRIRNMERTGRLSEFLENDEDIESLLKWTGLQKAAELADSCSKYICDEILVDSKQHNYIHSFPQGSNLSALIVLPLMGANTIDFRESSAFTGFGSQEDIDSIYLGHLSSGTAGVLLWIRWLSLKIAHHYGFVPGWEEQPAILLMDEIENHLHPTWQRRVIPALMEHFPGLQIFATTHSPFVVAGREAGQVHKLARDAKGVVTATTEQRDVFGWTMDEILRGMMEVDEPTDQGTVDRANRLRELRDKDSLNEKEEEELNQLRRQVNSDLLNRVSPLEAQRKRYADLVQDFLRTRENEFSQDGE